MAGFLDSEQQIVDMVLTAHGKMLLSHGELRFVYWAAYDDDVNYASPVGSTGTTVGTLVPLLSGAALTAYTEAPLQREVVYGYRMFNLRSDDRTNVNRALMTVPPGWDVIPTSSVTFDRSTVQMSQQSVVQEFYQQDAQGNPTDAYSSTVNMGVVRFNSNEISINAEYSRESYPANQRLDGFYVKLLAAQTSSLALTNSLGDIIPEKIRYVEQHHTLNDDSEIVVGPELKIGTVSYGE